MAFKILSKKNGKRTISDHKGNDTIKVTKVLQFLTEVDPKKATIGTIVRFMWNPGNGTTLCWLQGEIDKRVDKYSDSKEKRWKTYKVRVKDLKVANYWGDDCSETLPETLVVNLTEKTTWAIGTEVTLDTSEEDEALRVELSDIPAVSEDSENEMISSTTGNNDEKGATGGIKTISTNMNEDNSE